jgi:aryl-alcohol dehydrogenase-like predicted oxidoreductase/enamine deaminase RidA (YjgF/YER057c/UK114 family)
MTKNLVETHKLSDNLEISRAITGLWQIADMEKNGNTLDPVATAKMMDPYFKAGLYTFDMADHYGSAEIIAGTYKNSGTVENDVRLLTKWVPKPGPVSREQVRSAIQERLSRLQSKKIDLLQYHAWSFSNPYWLDTLIYLQELKEEGLIGALGTTNFDTAHLRIAKSTGIEIVSNQISFSLIDRRGSGKMADYCAENSVSILAYGTLCGGFISKKWLGKSEPSQNDLGNWSLMKYKRFIDTAGGWDKFQNLLSVLDQVSSETDRSIATLASKFQLAQKAVGAVIIGARLGENSHIEDTTSLFTFDLNKDQMNRIQASLDELDPIPGDCGDEYRNPPYLTASGDLSHHLESIPTVYQTQQIGNNLHIHSGTPWESLAGYSRAIKIGDRILLSGTTATHGDLVVGRNDAAAQAHFIIDKIEASLESLGGKLSDVIRTRVFVKEQEGWKEAILAHGERFKNIQPANTTFFANLIGDEYLVEIEVEAQIQ